jgi:hypothetical protein
VLFICRFYEDFLWHTSLFSFSAGAQSNALVLILSGFLLVGYGSLPAAGASIANATATAGDGGVGGADSVHAQAVVNEHVNGDRGVGGVDPATGCTSNFDAVLLVLVYVIYLWSECMSVPECDPPSTDDAAAVDLESGGKAEVATAETTASKGEGASGGVKHAAGQHMKAAGGKAADGAGSRGESSDAGEPFALGSQRVSMYPLIFQMRLVVAGSLHWWAQLLTTIATSTAPGNFGFFAYPRPVVAIPGCALGLAYCALPPKGADRKVEPGAYNCNIGHYTAEGDDMIKTATTTVNMLHNLSTVPGELTALNAVMDLDLYNYRLVHLHHSLHLFTCTTLCTCSPAPPDQGFVGDVVAEFPYYGTTSDEDGEDASTPLQMQWEALWGMPYNYRQFNFSAWKDADSAHKWCVRVRGCEGANSGPKLFYTHCTLALV